MKKPLLSLLLCCAAGAAAAFTGTVDTKRQDGAVTRSLSVSNWKVDGRGVPSFDFRFNQTGGGCDYRREGRAVAGFDVNDGKVELQVYSGQDDSGNEGPQMLILYANDEDVVFSMPAQAKGKPGWMTFQDAVMRKSVPKKCGFTERGSSIRYKP
ncbi:hypothetical protein [Pseudoduganella chitinolytica]|uniref:Uncharacterized protein n=1 Tax=Pseudoduganella chitinolytica TaxID=34070 RepID=A0ABY8B4E6_9BURK|nr:hypothetical protein [Pseudoduganella chitinolytica]WEF30827.1 hypothetical protein PX653_15235 [Pseudoduganella chitinolytica]